MSAKPCPHPDKEQYATRGRAMKAMYTAWRTGRGKKLPTRVYRCRCGFWHTTSQAKRGR